MLQPNNRICVLMFEEIHLSSGLQYNIGLDCVDGFVDFGGSNRKPNFADHGEVSC